MTFENAYTYRRKPQVVHAVRMTAEGNIPITHAGTWWMRQAARDRRIVWANGQWLAYMGENHRRVAYPGDWLVFIDKDLNAVVMTDADFRALFEAHVEEEEEDA